MLPPTYRLILGLILLSTLFSGCQAPYFEGTITYAVVTTFNRENERLRRYYEEEKYGDQMIVYARADGAVRRFYPNSSEELGSRAVYYSPTTERSYASYRFMDTILTGNTNIEFLANKQLSACTGDVKTEVLGKQVGCLEVTGRDTTALQTTVSYRYYYPLEGLKINKEAYRNYHEGYLGKAYARSGAHWLRMELNYGSHLTVLEATGVQPRKIEDAEVEVLEGLPLKNID